MAHALITWILMATTIVGVVMILLYLKFGTGLATRLIGMLSLATVLASGGMFFAGLSGGTMKAQFSTAAVLTPLVLGIFFLVYRHVVAQLERMSSHLVTSAAQLAATAKEAAASAAQQASAVTEVSATVTELAETSKAASDSAQQVAQHGEMAASQGGEGVDAITRARQVLSVVAQVADIVEAVSGLADQSNFLAVNAGIEAAKAGESGKGFAVVASEVRSLAEQSKLATNRIRSALTGAEEGRKALDSAQDVVGALAQRLEESSDRARHISAAVNQQAAGIRQISDAMTNMAEASQSVATTASQLESAVTMLEELAAEARRFVAGNRA